MIPQQLWVFRAKPLRVVDGDTIDVEIDCGFRNRRTERLRLWGVNTPEKKTTTRIEGIAAQEFTEQWLKDSASSIEKISDATMITKLEWPLIIWTEKDDAFGRFLAKVWRVNDGQCLNDELLKSGNAVVDIR